MTCWAYSSTNNCTDTAAPRHPPPATPEVHTQPAPAPHQHPLHAQEQLEVLQPGQVHQSRHLQPGQVSQGGWERGRDNNLPCRPPLAGRQSPLSSHGRSSLAGETQPRLYCCSDQLCLARSPESLTAEESQGEDDEQPDSEESQEVREQQVLALRQHEEVSQHGLRPLSQLSVTGDSCD